MTRPFRVAIVGAGPAGIYAADLLTKAERDFEVSIDLFERLPTPFGLVRYGVAPDHPRIKGIINALIKVLDRGDIRLFSNVDYGTDITLDELTDRYDAVIFSTGCITDAPLNIPGVDLEGSFGAADFVNWYDSHPDVSQSWPLEAESVAVIGNGNVALDVARVLAKQADDMQVTEIPDHVYEGLKSSKVTDVHVFGRRGPAQAKFTPLELRELGHVPDVDIIVYPEDFEFDEGSMEAIESSNQVKQVAKTLTDFTLREPTGASRRLHLHFLHAPTEILGDGQVEGLRTERQELDGTGNVRGTGEFVDWPVQAVYRAVGYAGSALPQLPFDPRQGVIPNHEGRVVDTLDQAEAPSADVVAGVYATGWIKRGPVGLIGHTKGDALETIGHLIADRGAGVLSEPVFPEESAIVDLLESKGVDFVDWEGYHRVEAAEKAAGEVRGRERVKIATREGMLAAARDAARAQSVS
ncbi:MULTISPECIES: FAD-dependent oxidoreductase [Brevibacterium]|uniref:ferredoxin--NADP(+) reductase n=2 Tax=Brevibacterium TaxID=1696 RepID=A0A165EC50_9MICO|nr:FAD-dependent oxidoreductase [Brevibacterium casei]KZE22422.1 pyridine nucleotide-disulfide oxidoreductase [Brevibacterium casei]MBE4695428.1 FAD-dependent oxidoreductase [Brevibacterium casei]MBY3578550.1 FAD-dependent oxidoreductase [Brevibacterium casei]MCT1448307.1 FAD-dependent oxidoreductase [Brevibacterium casei]MCT1764961.1 FAD-dependent oxidoreductase [Brevibacterium casei]